MGHWVQEGNSYNHDQLLNLKKYILLNTTRPA